MNKLQHRIIEWIDIQAFYLPKISLIRDADLSAATAENSGLDPEPKPENIKLYLPSDIDDAHAVPVPAKFNEYEWRLREGQAYGALHDLRHSLRLKRHDVNIKKRFSRGVNENLRSNDTIRNSQGRIDSAARQYRRARAALLKLSSKPGVSKVRSPTWEVNLRELHAADIRGLDEGAEGETMGTRTLSWIWIAEGVTITEGEENERTHEGRGSLNMDFI